MSVAIIFFLLLFAALLSVSEPLFGIHIDDEVFAALATLIVMAIGLVVLAF